MNSLAGGASWCDDSLHGIARIGGEPVGVLRRRCSAVFGGYRHEISEGEIRTPPGVPGASFSGCKGIVDPMPRTGGLPRVGIPSNPLAVTQVEGDASIRPQAEEPHARD